MASVAGGKMGEVSLFWNRLERTRSKAVAPRLQWASGGWWTKWPHICVRINREEQLGSKTDHTTQGSSLGNKVSNPLNEKSCGG